jgi:hypothetical protein
MKNMLKKSALDKLGTLLLAVAIWYVVRQRTELHKGGRPAQFQQPPAAR